MMIKRLISAALAMAITAGIIGGAAVFAAAKTLPKIDGSTSTIALDAAFTAAYTGADYDKTLDTIKHSKTFESLEKLIAGEVDIVLSVPISDEQQAAADKAGFELAKEAVALEGFVFITNPENPVKSLTEDELRGIYSGEITNWAEVGGENAPIYAYQRNLDSGSQTYMNRFMGDTKMIEPPKEWYFTSMGHLVEAVSDYPTSKYSIGYSVYSYAVEELARQKNFHLVAVNGVAPEKSSFEDGSYPLLSYTYAYYSGATATKQTLDFIDFILSDKGQKAAENAGYIPIRNLGAKPYSAKGTGEVRPENRIETQKFSSFNLYGRLDGVLANSETEKKINAWLNAQEPLPDEQGIWFEAINGYMNIYYGVLFGESAYPAENCITSCWNLKTGERLEKFTDLFYKDSDFVPAMNRAFGMYFDEIDFVFSGEPKNFNVKTLTDLTDTKPRYRETGGDDEKEKAINAFGEAYKEMPAWEYFDMTPLFSDDYKEMVFDEKADLWTEQYFTYEKLLESKIYYSRFLPQSEIERRNIQLEKLYDIIEQSEEYKNYDYSTDRNAEFDEPIVTEIDFSEDGNIAYVWTPFGEFTLNSKTNKYKTPSNDFIMRNDTKFIGYIDYDLDGTPETVTLDTSINIYNEKWELLLSIPYTKEYRDGYYLYEDYIKMWHAQKTSDKTVSGTIICDEKTFNYTVSEGAPKLSGIGTEINCYLGNENVVYAAGAADYPDFEYVSGKAKADFNDLQSEIKTLKEKAAEAGYFALLTIQDGKRYIVGMSSAENVLYINGMANKSEAFGKEFVDVDVTETFDYDLWRNRYSVYLIFWDSGMQSYQIPVFFGKDDIAIFPVSEQGIGQGMSINENNITISHQTQDITEDEKYLAGTGITQRVSNKDYWFYKDGETLIEYGAVPISREAFKKIKGSEDVLKEIAADVAQIDSFLYRANGVVNINCTDVYHFRNQEYIRNVNYTVVVWKSTDLNNSTGEYTVTYRTSLTPPVMNDGIYLPSVLETVGLHNVIYPDELPE
jgi:phosphate transport system substrate-binding protein